MSALIPCWNESRHQIEHTVASAVAALAAAGGGEVIVVDDGSEEPVTAIDGAVVIRAEHRGIAATLNTAAQAASCDYVAWLSVGDSWDWPKLLCQLAFNKPASFHDYRNFHGIFTTRRDWIRNLERDNQFCGSTTMVRRELALEFPFDESLKYAVDWEWALKIQFKGPGWDYLPVCLGEAFELNEGHTMRAERSTIAAERKREDKARIRRHYHGCYKQLCRERGRKV